MGGEFDKKTFVKNISDKIPLIMYLVLWIHSVGGGICSDSIVFVCPTVYKSPTSAQPPLPPPPLKIDFEPA